MVSLFYLADTITTIKVEAECTLDKCKDVVIPMEDPAGHFLGFGQDSIQSVLRPLVFGPKVNVNVKMCLKLDNLGLTDEHILIIKARANALFNYNKCEVDKHVNAVGHQFNTMYNNLLNFANSTSDSIRVFWRCFQVPNFITRKLMRSKMLSFFKPSFI